MAAVIPYAIAAVGAVQAYGQYQQGKANASALNRNADLAQQQANADAASQRIKARLQIGTSAAQYGASGLSFEGTPTDMLAQSAMFAELDAQNILYKGDVKAYGYRQQARDAKRAGTVAAASTLLQTGFGVASSMGMFSGTPVTDVTGTAASGGNVTISSGSYYG